MAKLKAPLFSLGASGQIGKALVYFPWKGLNVVREHVVPSNPRTTAQQTQRNYLSDAVDKIHEFQAVAANAISALDITAWALWGSTYPTPRTWFNQCVKNAIDQYRSPGNAMYTRNCTLTPAATQITIKAVVSGDPASPTTYNVFWGTSKTALINSQAVTQAQLVTGHAITGMPGETKIFLQVRATAPAASIGAMSGIYYAKTL